MAAPPTTWQKLTAEFLGTGFLVFVGAGSAAATGVIAAGTKAPFSMAELGMISFAFMLVIVGAVYAIGHISGGHINPAVTVSFAVTGKLPWRDVPGYVAAQVAGAVAGAAAIYATLGRLAAVKAGGGVTAYNPATTGFGRGTLIEAIGTFIRGFLRAAPRNPPPRSRVAQSPAICPRVTLARTSMSRRLAVLGVADCQARA
jgi:glycerol uptake facilitator protein